MTTTPPGILPYKLQLEEGERLGALDDPGPLPEGMHKNPTLLYAAQALIIRLEQSPGVFVDFNTFVYYDRTDRNRRVPPDLYVALGVDTVAIRERHGYLIWEVGKPPDFVLEIASESTAQYDCTGKRELYASLGVGEYWRYDSTGGDFYGTPLVGEHLVDGKYHPFEVHTNADGEIWAHSPALDVDIYWGEDRLRVYDPEHRFFIPGVDDVIQGIREAGEALASAQGELTDMRGALASAQDELTDMRGALANTQDELTDMHGAFANTQDELTNTRDALANTQDELTDTRDALATEEAAHRAERTARMRAEAELARLQEQLRRLQSD